MLNVSIWRTNGELHKNKTLILDIFTLKSRLFKLFLRFLCRAERALISENGYDITRSIKNAGTEPFGAVDYTVRGGFRE